MANIQFDNVEIVDAVYNCCGDIYGKPTLRLMMTFDDRLNDSERTKLKKLLNSQNESPDIKMAIGLQTYIPGAWPRKTQKELADEARKLFKQLDIMYLHPEVDHIFYDDVATVVFWTDGTKTVVKCPEGTPYDEYTAFCAALAKKLYGNNSKLQREIKKKARYSKKRKIAMLFDENIPEDTIRNIFLPQNKNSKLQHKADRIIGKVTSVKETDNGLEVEVTKND